MVSRHDRRNLQGIAGHIIWQGCERVARMMLNSGRRLEIRDANNEMQARFVGEWCRVSGSLDVAGDQLKFKRQRRAPDNDE